MYTNKNDLLPLLYIRWDLAFSYSDDDRQNHHINTAIDIIIIMACTTNLYMGTMGI